MIKETLGKKQTFSHRKSIIPLRVSYHPINFAKNSISPRLFISPSEKSATEFNIMQTTLDHTISQWKDFISMNPLTNPFIKTRNAVKVTQDQPR